MPPAPGPHASIYRIVDANFNRAREALRTIEEYARFVLNDGDLTAAAKGARHDLRRCMADLRTGDDGSSTASVLLRCRDTRADVGRDLRTDSEFRRTDALDVAVAAAKRLAGALRAIEEYGKVLDPVLAAGIEKIRYRGYELERRLVLTAEARERFGRFRLYVLVTESRCRGDWFETAEAALCGGAEVIQLREKALSDRRLIERATRLAGICHDRDAILIVNDRPDVAALSGADGVHLGQDDLDVHRARRIVSPSSIVGVSTHTIDQAKAAAESAPDYIAVGPMFHTATKPQDHIATPATLAAARGHTALPLVAVGGITLRNASSVLSAAPCCICVCTAVIAQADVAGTCRRFRELIDETDRKRNAETDH